MINKLFEMFNVSSQRELLKYIKENPEDDRVIWLKDLFKNMEFDEENSQLLKEFNVSSREELQAYIAQNPNDPKVKKIVSDFEYIRGENE